MKTSKKPLEVDRKDIADFIEAIFCNATDGEVDLRGFQTGNKPGGNWKRVPVSDKKALLDPAVELAGAISKLPNGVFCPPLCTFNLNGKAAEVDLCEGVVLSVDLDDVNPEEALAPLETVLGPATVVVESGGLWVHPETGDKLPKLHAHWRLTRPTKTSEEHDKLKQARERAARVAGADSSGIPVVHPLRWPGSWHLKEEPRRCRIRTIRQEQELDLDAVLEALKPPESPGGEVPSGRPERDKAPDDFYLLRRAWGGEGWHEMSRSLAYRMVQDGMSESRAVFWLRAAMPEDDGTQRWQERYRDIPRLVKTAAKKRSQSAPDDGRGFKLMRAASFELRPPQWLVKGLLEKDSVNTLYGDPGTGKSFVAMDIACSVATGREFGPCESSGGPVIYVAGEGQNGIRRRTKAWELRRDQSLEDAPLFMSTAPANLTATESLQSVIAAIDSIAIDSGFPELIVIDTVARNFGPGDENSTQDMGKFIAACDQLRVRYDCCVLLVHHTGHADKNRARGSTALKGALDAEYQLEKDQSGVIRLTAQKMKEAERPKPMAFTLETVGLGILDDDGKEVTSAVLRHRSYTEPPAKGTKGRGKWQDLARRILRDLTMFEDDQCVPFKEWRDACGKKGMVRQRFSEVVKTFERDRTITYSERAGQKHVSLTEDMADSSVCPVL